MRPKKPIYDVIKAALVARGWKYDPNAVENRFGEVLAFTHPKSGRPMTWIDALVAQHERDV